MKTKLLKFLIIISYTFSVVQAGAQNNPGFSVKTTAELVSSYIWRGVPCYSYTNNQPVLAPNIQPALGFVMGNLEIGAWGSTDFTGSYKEFDLYASYSYKTITATLTDYYWDLNWLSKPYFSYKNETTSHVLEGMIAYKSSKIPLSISLATMFYGADKKAGDATKNNFSTYKELGYTFSSNGFNFDTFLGMTPADGFYGDSYGNVTGFGIVNLGVTGSRKIKFSEKFESTLRSSVIFNPQQDKAYLVLGIAF